MVDSGKELIEGLLHKPVVFTNHSVSFTRTSLSIDKYTRVIPIQNIIQELVADVVEDIFLGGRGRKDFIESKLVLFKLDLSLSVCQYALLLLVGLYSYEDLD